MFSFKQGFKRARKKTGLTQVAFADKYHFSIPTVKKWEQGTATPEIGTLCTLCDIFHCSMDYLFAVDELPTHELQFIHDETGLSLQSIEKLKTINAVQPELSRVLSAVIEDGNFEYLLYLLCKRFDYSIPAEKVAPIIESVEGKIHCKNAKEYHASLKKREIQISLDGSQILAQKSNLIDSLISSAITDRMQNMAEAYQRMKGEGNNG